MREADFFSLQACKEKTVKSFVNTIQESLIKPTCGTRIVFIKYQQGSSNAARLSNLKLIVRTLQNVVRESFVLFCWTKYTNCWQEVSMTQIEINSENDMHGETNHVAAFVFV